ncbi:MAG TPA: hypothetical protein VFF13_00770 [archaeon]|nr:hypothetical protein [archaeon]
MARRGKSDWSENPLGFIGKREGYGLNYTSKRKLGLEAFNDPEIAAREHPEELEHRLSRAQEFEIRMNRNIESVNRTWNSGSRKLRSEELSFLREKIAIIGRVIGLIEADLYFAEQMAEQMGNTTKMRETGEKRKRIEQQKADIKKIEENINRLHQA